MRASCARCRSCSRPSGSRRCRRASSACRCPTRPATCSPRTPPSRPMRPPRPRACRRSPTIPASASMRSTARRACSRPTGPGRSRDFHAAMERVERELREARVPTDRQRPFRLGPGHRLARRARGAVRGPRLRRGRLAAARRRRASATIPCSSPTASTETFGEISSEEKHGIDWSKPEPSGLSHRARAFVKLAAGCLRRVCHCHPGPRSGARKTVETPSKKERPDGRSAWLMRPIRRSVGPLPVAAALGHVGVELLAVLGPLQLLDEVAEGAGLLVELAALFLEALAARCGGIRRKPRCRCWRSRRSRPGRGIGRGRPWRGRSSHSGRPSPRRISDIP